MLKVASSQKVFHFGSHLQKKVANYSLEHRFFKGGLKSETTGRILHCPKNVLKTILELFNPVHVIDKMSIVNFFAFADLIYLLQVL